MDSFCRTVFLSPRLIWPLIVRGLSVISHRDHHCMLVNELLNRTCMISTQHPEYVFVEQNKKRFDLLKLNEPQEFRKVLTKELTVKRLRSN